MRRYYCYQLLVLFRSSFSVLLLQLATTTFTNCTIPFLPVDGFRGVSSLFYSSLSFIRYQQHRHYRQQQSTSNNIRRLSIKGRRSPLFLFVRKITITSSSLMNDINTNSDDVQINNPSNNCRILRSRRCITSTTLLPNTKLLTGTTRTTRSTITTTPTGNHNRQRTTRLQQQELCHDDRNELTIQSSCSNNNNTQEQQQQRLQSLLPPITVSSTTSLLQNTDVTSKRKANNDNNKNNNKRTSSSSTSSSSSSLLEGWMHHTDVSFHYFHNDNNNSDINKNNNNEIVQMQKALLTWYYNHRRKLPWRGDPPPWNGSTAATSKDIDRTNDNDNHYDSKNEYYMNRTYPMTTYGVWVSEIMLQQTRVEAVIQKWCQFIDTYPNVTALANANITDVNAIWAGLGYYRRCKLLHNAAQMVVTKYDGIIPNTIPELLSLPGIGRYTAHAIASISYQQSVPVVDGNVCRVLSRLRCIGQTIKASSFKDQYGWILAQQLVTVQGTSTDNHHYNFNPSDINQALMELGATYCSPSGTGIHPNDPLKEYYWSTKLGIALANAITDQSIDKIYLNDNKNITTITSASANTTSTVSHSCPLCATNSVTEIITQFREKLLLSDMEYKNDDGTYNYESIQKLGHSMFPIPPPKVHKREELLIVTVLYRYGNKSKNSSKSTTTKSNDDVEWLFIKRPENNGLLSGQWEFPCTCIWQSDNDDVTNNKDGTKKVNSRNKIPRQDMSDNVPTLSIAQRRKHATKLLNDMMHGQKSTNITLNSVSNEPIHHVFSHVRHTMYIEYARIEEEDEDQDVLVLSSNSSSHHYNETNLQWMNQSAMDQVGITSGVKKVLDVVIKEIRGKSSSNTNKKKSGVILHDDTSTIREDLLSSKKRKRTKPS